MLNACRQITAKLGALLALVLAAQSSGTGQTLPDGARSLLQKYFGFSQTDVRDVERGNIVVKVLSSQDGREIAPIAVTRIAVPRRLFIEKLRDIENFKKSDIVLQIGKFSVKPRVEDLQHLILEPGDIDALKSCSPGSCRVKAPADWMRRFRSEIDWSSPARNEAADQFIRQILSDYAGAYLSQGNPVLVEYNDRKETVRVREELQSMLNQSPYLLDSAPEFYRYVEQYPAVNLQRVESFIYWSKEKYRYKPMTSITHVNILNGETSASPTMICSKQIYANHYFDSSLALSWLFDDGTGSGLYLIYVNRTRVDALRGAFAWLKRLLVRGPIRDGVKKYVGDVRQKLEANQP